MEPASRWLPPLPVGRPMRPLRPLRSSTAGLACPVPSSSSQPERPADRPRGMRRHCLGKPFIGFASPHTELDDRSPAGAGLDGTPIVDALAQIAAWQEPCGAEHPLYAGAVTLMGHDGHIVAHQASGYALRYADGSGTELPRDQWVPMDQDTIFDMASVSKLFTSIVVMQQIERGAVRLEEPVATYLPAFAANGKGDITVRQLLTHTSGLRPLLPLWSDWPDRGSRISAVLDVPPTSPPATTYVYSDLNLITLGVLVERQTGKGLNRLVREQITVPLTMKDTGYNPDPLLRARIAATEFEADPPRGMVRGQVHDENSWSLGGVSGHAGVFSTAPDMAVLAQALINGGTYGGHRILSQASVQTMTTDYNAAFPGHAHGLGFELDQSWFMDALSSRTTAGHTGYTGTSIVIDFRSGSFAILLSNRIHPSRNWGSSNPARCAAAQGLALAMGLPPRQDPIGLASGTGDAATTTLTTGALDALQPDEGGRPFCEH